MNAVIVCQARQKGVADDKASSNQEFKIEKIDSNGILVNIKSISQEKVEINQFYLDENIKIPAEEKCCKTVKFLFKTPIIVGQTIEDDFKIFATGTAVFTATKVWGLRSLFGRCVGSLWPVSPQQ